MKEVKNQGDEELPLAVHTALALPVPQLKLPRLCIHTEMVKDC